MSDPASPRPTKGWPLIAISLLVLLLAGFLVVKWRKREDIPGIVKAPPLPVEPVKPPDPVKGPDPVKPPPPPDPVTPPADPKAGEFEQKLKELQAALAARKWDDAAGALEAARKLRADAPELKGVEEAVAEGRKQAEAERVEAARKAALKQQQSREWALLKDKVEKDREQNLWDACLAAFEKFAAAYPEAVKDEDYKGTLKKTRDFQGEADTYFKRDLAEAKKQHEAGRYGQALATSEGALVFYPERKAQVREFQQLVKTAQSEKTMVRIPSTPCWIGNDDVSDEKPLRQVKLAAFLIDKYEVTNEDYLAFTIATGRPPPPHWGGTKPPKKQERHPVVFVTWDDATAYASWAGKRLPTAEEWEVAARGPDKREFPWGSVFLEKEDKFAANCLEYWQVHKSISPGTTAVDDKEFDNGESAFGVYGMGGNVWEWTETSAPAKGTKPPPEFRILKGGSFMTPKKALRCANVYAEDPRLPHPDVGFRCARDVK
ncbi:MAG: SUMF1/EgtB/PvdO family nonheme iron enzyme [Planctomycetes bacterium]|nr:SUMF1/EgtB/PvdO family nonheme iron enzyme [Planctomycetota bacterium]